MDYLSVAEAQHQSGLRLALTRGVPGPWSEAAKAVFALRGVTYQAVEQQGGRANPALIAWTGHRNAPIALYNDEPPRVRWLEILDLAERLGSGPSLLPDNVEARMLTIGLCNEIAGENGFAWNARMLMLNAGYQAQGDRVIEKNPMYKEYQYSEEKVSLAHTRVVEFLTLLADRLHQQQEQGSAYLIGHALTVADAYWACFSNMLQSLPPEQNPMPDGLRGSWAVLAKSIDGYDEILIRHRDHIFATHLKLPLTF
jgi:glutathione S-transferase